MDTVVPQPGQRLRLSGRRLGMLLPHQPVEVELGSGRLHIQKEIRCDSSVGPGLPDLIVFNPDLDPTQINYSLRIKPGQSLHISHDEPNQEHLFRKPREAFRRNFHLNYEGGSLVFRDPISELGTFITLLEEDVEQSPIVARRQQAIDKIIALYGGPLETMSRHKALDTLQQVNSLLKNDAFRPKDANGTAGGLLRLPAHVTPVVIGESACEYRQLTKDSQ